MTWPAARPRRRAHGDKNHLRTRNRDGVIRGEFEIAAGFGNQLGQKRFIERYLAALECSDLAFVRVNAGHIVPQVSETSPRGQTHIAGAKNGNIHIPYLTTGSAFDK